MTHRTPESKEASQPPQWPERVRIRFKGRNYYAKDYGGEVVLETHVDEVWSREKDWLPYLSLTEHEARLKELREERDKWKDEYENLCKFANDYEEQRDAALSKVKELESNAEARRSQHANVILLGRQVDALRAKLEKAIESVNQVQGLLRGFTTNSSDIFAPIKEAWNVNARLLSDNFEEQTRYLDRLSGAEKEGKDEA